MSVSAPLSARPLPPPDPSLAYIDRDNADRPVLDSGHVGYVNAFGVYQEYYQLNYIPEKSSFDIA